MSGPSDRKKISENKDATQESAAHENDTPENKDERMWGGRFDRQPDRGFYEFQRSFRFDRRLLPYELRASRAWARALGRAGVLKADKANQIISALDAVERMAKDDPGRVAASPAEDVHHFVESELIERLGPLGAKLHTGRSRNEQVVTDLLSRDGIDALRDACDGVNAVFPALLTSQNSVCASGNVAGAGTGLLPFNSVAPSA